MPEMVKQFAVIRDKVNIHGGILGKFALFWFLDDSIEVHFVSDLELLASKLK